jgi:hypothetical protein
MVNLVGGVVNHIKAEKTMLLHVKYSKEQSAVLRLVPSKISVCEHKSLNKTFYGTSIKR